VRHVRAIAIALSLAASALGSARAADDADFSPVCPAGDLARLPEPAERIAVAWVGRWRQRPRGALHVVPAAELAGWVASQQPPWSGRTLQRLGLRRRNKDPSRSYKVVIYEVDREALCRPVLLEEGVDAGAVPACAPRLSKPTRARTGCGQTLDRRTGEPGLTLFVVRRRHAADQGHCAVPLDRYLRQAGR